MKTYVVAATSLIKAAVAARQHAYAPYSKFKVGAALMTVDGRVFTGCNIENASYGATICAERVALFKAVSEGCTEFATIAVVYDRDELATPCGICRQALAEFGGNITVIHANLRGECECSRVSDLLPRSFSLKKQQKQSRRRAG